MSVHLQLAKIHLEEFQIDNLDWPVYLVVCIQRNESVLFCDLCIIVVLEDR